MKCVGRDWRWKDVSLFSSLAFLWFTLSGWFPNRQTCPRQARVTLKRLSTTCDERTFQSKTNNKTFLLKQSASWWGVRVVQRIWTDRKRKYDLEKKCRNTQSSLIHRFCLILFYFVKKLNICFYLNFSSYLSASQPQRVTRGRRDPAVVTSNMCTCSSGGHEAEPSSASGFHGTGLCIPGRLPVREHICPMWALLLHVISNGVNQPLGHPLQETDWFCFHGTQKGVFDFMLELFLSTVVDFADVRQTEDQCGDHMFKWCFSVKLGNLMTYLTYNLFILPLFAWC